MRAFNVLLLGVLALGACAKERPRTTPDPRLDTALAEVREGPLIIDLAALPKDSMVIPLSGGSYTVTLLNLAPARSYTVTLDMGTIIPAALPIPAETAVPRTTTPPKNQAEQLRSDTACAALDRLGDALLETRDEQLVPSRIDAVKLAMEPCKDPVRKREASRRIDATRRALGPIQIRPGRTATVRIVRENAPSERWVRTFSGGPRGEWRTTYGFNYVVDWLSEEQRYFLEETDVQGSYTIGSRRSADRLLLTPTLFYTWMPAVDSPSGWSGSYTVGLGFDLKAPVISAGYAWTYNHNLSVSLGGSFHQVQRLNEQFTVGETVSDIKTGDALHRSVYRLNPYVAISIRSLTNPFQRAPSDPQP